MALDNPVPASDERVLVGQCVAGDREAQRRLFREESRRVHLTLFRILGSNQEIEDLIQETFLQVFSSLATFRGESALSTWIGRITTRVAFAYIRSRARRPLASDLVEELSDAAPRLDATVAARQAIAALYAALDSLDAKYRIAYALHIIDGRPLADVAELTGARLSAVKSRVSRARRAINAKAARDPRLAAYLTEQGARP